MNAQIPLSLETELLAMGVLDSTELDEEIAPPVERNYEFRWPVFDENGEPDF